MLRWQMAALEIVRSLLLTLVLIPSFVEAQEMDARKKGCYESGGYYDIHAHDLHAPRTCQCPGGSKFDENTLMCIIKVPSGGPIVKASEHLTCATRYNRQFMFNYEYCSQADADPSLCKEWQPGKNWCAHWASLEKTKSYKASVPKKEKGKDPSSYMFNPLSGGPSKLLVTYRISGKPEQCEEWHKFPYVDMPYQGFEEANPTIWKIDFNLQHFGNDVVQECWEGCLMKGAKEFRMEFVQDFSNDAVSKRSWEMLKMTKHECIAK